MPIRFRCAYCSQLMGIARRKAGTVVRCPTCSGQVVVPTPDAPESVDGPASPAGSPLFERSDFDRLLEGPVRVEPPRPAPAPMPPAPAPVPAWLPSADPRLDVERVPAGSSGPHPPGVLLTPNQLTVIAVVAVLLLALVFGLGVLVGRLLR